MMDVRSWLLEQLWYVQPMTALTVKALPNDCVRALTAATRPNLDRLHLRNLFMDGRRYYVEVLKDGFQITSNTSVPWRRRARSSVAAVLLGQFGAAGANNTLIQMRVRMRVLYLLDVFPIPLFLTSILIFAPWSKFVIVGLVTLLFFLSWMGHRLTARLQAVDMVYFVEKVLEEVITTDTRLLGSQSDTVVTPDQEFPAQWRKFYDEHKGD